MVGAVTDHNTVSRSQKSHTSDVTAIQAGKGAVHGWTSVPEQPPACPHVFNLLEIKGDDLYIFGAAVALHKYFSGVAGDKRGAVKGHFNILVPFRANAVGRTYRNHIGG